MARAILVGGVSGRSVFDGFRGVEAASCGFFKRTFFSMGVEVLGGSLAATVFLGAALATAFLGAALETVFLAEDEAAAFFADLGTGRDTGGRREEDKESSGKHVRGRILWKNSSLASAAEKTLIYLPNHSQYQHQEWSTTHPHSTLPS